MVWLLENYPEKNGESYYTSYKLVESIRTEKGPRQRVLLNLEADFNVPQDDWKALCDILTEKFSKQPSVAHQKAPFQNTVRILFK
jgi:hypothetical protein